MNLTQLSQLREAMGQAFVAAGNPPLAVRLDRLHRLEQAVRAEEPAILSALQRDLGKCAFEGVLAEVGFLYEEIKYVRRRLAKWMRPQRTSTPLPVWFAKSQIMAEPRGTVLIIGPWNYPFQLIFSPLVGALAAGNNAVIKPSELAPHTAEAIARVVERAFSAEEVVVVQGGVEVARALVSLPWDHLFFTGGTGVGRAVMKSAAETLTPVTLELGGKSPCLVDETANLAVAARRIVWGKFLNSGQTCVAPDYVLVHRSVADEFSRRLQAEIRAQFGEAVEQCPDYGRIISVPHWRRLLKLLEGQQVLCGGKGNEESKYFAPTLVLDPSWDSPLMQDEIFGPILPLLKFENLDEAIRLVQSRPRPLALYHFSELRQHQERVTQACSFGGGCINDTLVHLISPELPFGGVGASGMGAYHGKHSFTTFSHLKSLVKRATWFDPKLRYPPYGNKLKVLRRWLGM